MAELTELESQSAHELLGLDPVERQESMTSNQGTPMRTPWGLIVLMVLVMTISFIDRGNLSVAAPAMVADMKLSAWAMGLLLSAFF